MILNRMTPHVSEYAYLLASFISLMGKVKIRTMIEILPSGL